MPRRVLMTQYGIEMIAANRRGRAL